MLEGKTVQIIVQGSTNFMITSDMLYIDEEVTQKPLKEIDTLDFEFPNIVMKELYKL